ncbi:MAG: hypothetical protein CVU96_02250 [Firmicutes bacterium HGW-Firmicutes-20]|jgi:hypothetical protein|nr:MAG: hypothetical protein CVU96_02250 [Firmicutes bacterium HGW-Firmicutes-20]PKM69617.1 MAG: hypothetical protein CVU94_03020 [Firmicutes bacterium HGW-Firmicutes-19]
MNNPFIHIIPLVFGIIYFSIIALLHWKLNIKYSIGLLFPLFMTIIMNLMSIPSYIRLITGEMGEGDWLLMIFALWQLGILIFYVILWRIAESFSSKKESE